MQISRLKKILRNFSLFHVFIHYAYLTIYLQCSLFLAICMFYFDSSSSLFLTHSFIRSYSIDANSYIMLSCIISWANLVCLKLIRVWHTIHWTYACKKLYGALVYLPICYCCWSRQAGYQRQLINNRSQNWSFEVAPKKICKRFSQKVKKN